MAITYIYILRCPDSGLVKYVGQTKNPKRRIIGHLQEAKINKQKNKKCAWITSLLKENKKPIYEIIDEVIDNVPFWEQYYVSLFKSWDFELKNHTNGGEIGGGMSGKKGTEYQKQIISKIMKGNSYAKGYSNAAKSISCIDIKKGVINYYDSLEQASIELSILRQSIGNNLTKISKRVDKRYYFDYQ